VRLLIVYNTFIFFLVQRNGLGGTGAGLEGPLGLDGHGAHAYTVDEHTQGIHDMHPGQPTMNDSNGEDRAHTSCTPVSDFAFSTLNLKYLTRVPISLIVQRFFNNIPLAHQDRATSM
jgi:hypothetical protein